MIKKILASFILGYFLMGNSAQATYTANPECPKDAYLWILLTDMFIRDIAEIITTKECTDADTMKLIASTSERCEKIIYAHWKTNKHLMQHEIVLKNTIRHFLMLENPQEELSELLACYYMTLDEYFNQYIDETTKSAIKDSAEPILQEILQKHFSMSA